MIIKVKMVVDISPRHSGGDHSYAGIKEVLYRKMAGMLDTEVKYAFNCHGFILNDMEIVVEKDAENEKDTKMSDADNAQAISDSL